MEDVTDFILYFSKTDAYLHRLSQSHSDSIDCSGFVFALFSFLLESADSIALLAIGVLKASVYPKVRIAHRSKPDIASLDELRFLKIPSLRHSRASSNSPYKVPNSSSYIRGLKEQGNIQ